MNERRSAAFAASLRRTRDRARAVEQRLRATRASDDEPAAQPSTTEGPSDRPAETSAETDHAAAHERSQTDIRQDRWDLAPYRNQLPQTDGRGRVAVLAPAYASEHDLQAMLAQLSGVDVTVLRSIGGAGSTADDPSWTAASTRRAHNKLKAVGPVEMIVDLVATSPDQDPWRGLFLHLRPGGLYLKSSAPATEHPAGDDPPPVTRWPTDLLTSSRVLSDSPGGASSLADELAASCARFSIDRSFLVLEKRQQHYLKVRDADITQLLPRRNTQDSVSTVATLPAGELACRGEVNSHTSAVEIHDLDLAMAYPELHVYHYQGQIAMVRNSLLYTDATVLPGSFRYPLTKRLSNPRLVDVNSDFARVPPEFVPRVLLEGDFYHLDCWNPGHFGHVITEVVSRLWGWPAAKAQFPELKAIFRRRNPDDLEPALELNLFSAYGIDRADIIWVDEPVLLESVVTATPMWENVAPYYVHPQITETWTRLRTALVDQRPDRPRRIFVSRRPTLKNRACRNIAAVEEVFVRHGFAVVFPEELPLREQATLFGGAEVVAGFAGSGLYNVLYGERLTTLIVLAQEAYTARYEHLYTMVLGCTTHYFWSTPDVPHPVGGWSEDAYYSAWEFDFDRNSAELEAVLGELG